MSSPPAAGHCNAPAVTSTDSELQHLGPALKGNLTSPLSKTVFYGRYIASEVISHRGSALCGHSAVPTCIGVACAYMILSLFQLHAQLCVS